MTTDNKNDKKPKYCIICQCTDNVNYKCPKCSVSYCSVKCCNTHKAICSNTNNATTTIINTTIKQNSDSSSSSSSSSNTIANSITNDSINDTQNSINNNNNNNTVNDANISSVTVLEEGEEVENVISTNNDRIEKPTRDLLSIGQLNALKSSPWLHQILGSKRLRNDIIAVDSASNRQVALTRFRHNNKEFEDFTVKLLQEIGHINNDNNNNI